MPLWIVGSPDMFALVAISGCPIFSIMAFKTGDFACRSANRPVLPVTFNGTFAAAGTIIVSGPGQKCLARMKNLLVNSLARSSAINMSEIARGRERTESLPLEAKTLPTA
jgi:hypothetical protein